MNAGFGYFSFLIIAWPIAYAITTPRPVAAMTSTRLNDGEARLTGAAELVPALLDEAAEELEVAGAVAIAAVVL